ncbi:hypothetical protein Lser_V15G37345 [Lactuca serriola]
MELACLSNLIMTPDFDGLPNLERFILRGCRCLKEIHPSIGRLKRLVFLSIEFCAGLKIFPPITQLKKLETFSLSHCPKLFKLSWIERNLNTVPFLHLNNSGKGVASSKKTSSNIFATCWACGDTEVKKPQENLSDVEECYLEEACLHHNSMNHHTLLRFFPKSLRKLNLRYCNLGDIGIGSAVWELPNLEELILKENEFSHLNFSLLQLPRLKWLDVSRCIKLVELSELPSSIVVVIADGCDSLESIGDISNCKWLWKVSLLGVKNLRPWVGDILVRSMLQGNAVEDHFISVALEHQMIPKRLIGRLHRLKTFKLPLPHDWRNDFCGFLICIITNTRHPIIKIIIKREADEDSRSELWQESNEALDSKYGKSVSLVGYVSFSSLSRTGYLNSTYNMISFSIYGRNWSGPEANSYVGAELVPRKSKGDDRVQTTDWSEFWDKDHEHGNTFTIHRDAHSSIKILWQPYYCTQQVVVKVDIYSYEDIEKAMLEVIHLSGVESVSLMKDTMDVELAVIGDVDPADIVVRLRKCCYAEIVTTGPAKDW